MTRLQAKKLIDKYTELNKIDELGLFNIRFSYPLFHLIRSYAKGWKIESAYENDFNVKDPENVNFESIMRESNRHRYEYVARNPKLTNTTLGFVIYCDDVHNLYYRYVNSLSPLNTTWTRGSFFPLSEVSKSFKTRNYFDGFRGTTDRLYLLEIDLDTTEIVGNVNPKEPWYHQWMGLKWKMNKTS